MKINIFQSDTFEIHTAHELKLHKITEKEKILYFLRKKPIHTILFLKLIKSEFQVQRPRKKGNRGKQGAKEPAPVSCLLGCPSWPQPPTAGMRLGDKETGDHLQSSFVGSGQGNQRGTWEAKHIPPILFQHICGRTNFLLLPEDNIIHVLKSFDFQTLGQFFHLLLHLFDHNFYSTFWPKSPSFFPCSTKLMRSGEYSEPMLTAERKTQDHSPSRTCILSVESRIVEMKKLARNYIKSLSWFQRLARQAVSLYMCSWWGEMLSWNLSK